mmetsp:Transcript_71505/g.149511  ORF Transcript_71505/g.149511 Transcript_71505/m.149511 type:complete len:244 (+) Transcript_71505:137-868(+)|eukprot:CAMPEP_0206529022 /NCGR_PEP_ID=MMETSP0325_2-20121206/2343_1 /ASSEMBLY_ACC=CAM_ASM_000347 /TAXON_ID=2866 /ORGANISM="Crypthecodinium cohnii, Strain Seligo" /LENGTH=243 /DNA_ID=CAMNT_0054024837 /DNA_START=112 /DNA_END=843 /DNA_ORIENTATION=-
MADLQAGPRGWYRPQTELRAARIKPAEAALVIVDVQNYCCHYAGGIWACSSEEEAYNKDPAFWDACRAAIGKMAKLIDVCRQKRIEVIYTVIESLTRDGRDRSLDYKISGLFVPKGSVDAQVVDEIKPTEDEMVLPKTSCSVFQSTILENVLRSMEIKQVMVVGGLTDQCVESAIRDGCDKGFLMTQVTDACYTYGEERQRSSVAQIKGFCRQCTTEQLIGELEGLEPAPAWQENGFRAEASG